MLDVLWTRMLMRLERNEMKMIEMVPITFYLTVQINSLNDMCYFGWMCIGVNSEW